MVNPTDLDQVAGLDVARWERARETARNAIRGQVAKPEKELYTRRSYSKYPRSATLAVLFVLIIVAAGAFWVSAGKQIAATDLALSPLTKDYGRLSSGWADVSIVLNLLLGELGTILFFTASGMFPGPVYRIRACEVALVSVAFRLAGILCACYAILANVTITALHPISDIAAYNWFITLAAPMTVLGIGLLIERMAMETLEARSKAMAEYHEAYASYLRYQTDPEAHPAFKKYWHWHILDQLTKVSQLNKRKIEDLVAQDSAVRPLLIQREFNRHEWASAIEIEPSRPTPPSLALPAEGQLPLALSQSISSNSLSPSETP